MATDDLWITARLNEIRKLHPSVTDAVSARLKELLNGQLCNHQLTPVELRKVAKTLIEDMISASSSTEAKR